MRSGIHPARGPGRRCCLHLWKFSELRQRYAACRQSRQKPRLVASYAALAVLEAMRASFASASSLLRFGGAYRDRTDDLKLAKLALSQLS